VLHLDDVMQPATLTGLLGGEGVRRPWAGDHDVQFVVTGGELVGTHANSAARRASSRYTASSGQARRRRRELSARPTKVPQVALSASAPNSSSRTRLIRVLSPP
jgi:hypothetical protein